MKNIALVLLLFLSCSTAAQTDEISTTLKTYFSLLEKKEISEALDYVHPDLINMLGKETFEQQYTQLFNSPGIEVSLEQFAIDSLSELHAHEEAKYALVHYSFQMTFKIDISQDESGLLPDVLLSSYQTQFGEENVTSEVPGTYLINIERGLFAVQSPKFQGWKILDYDEGMRVFLVSIIPEPVLTHFKK